MSSLYLPQKNAGFGSLRLDTLSRLRWMAIAGQLFAVSSVYFGLGFALPFEICLALIAISAGVNIVSRLRYPVTARVSPERAAAFLAFDIVQLASLLYLTGGLQNPFSFLFLAPVMISSTSLPPRLTIGLGALATVCATLLTHWHLPLPWFPGETLKMPITYILGMWCSVLLGLGFIGIYAWRVAEEARLLSNALAATELVLAREQHLSQLDGLATAAAHELGTPLATVAIVARELEIAASDNSGLLDDIRLLRSQVERCRDILGKLTLLGTEEHTDFLRLTPELLVEETSAPYRDFGVSITIRCNGDPENIPTTSRNAGLLHALGNLVENAVDFARSEVTVSTSWDDKAVTLIIADDGPGFAPEIMARLGDPYVTHRRKSADAEAAGGLGLGFFIAKTLLERSGASVKLGSRKPPETGAIVAVRWPREAFER